MNNPFYFKNDINNFDDKNSFIAIISSAEGEDELYKELNEKLKLPDYFGFNWDALEECINNFEWINEKKIILIHENLPNLNKQDLRIYLSILKTAILNWQKTPKEHVLEVVFPQKDESMVNKLLLGRYTVL